MNNNNNNQIAGAGNVPPPAIFRPPIINIPQVLIDLYNVNGFDEDSESDEN
jgi:hypothetical protein